jgi:hypothetical protein
MGPRLLKLRVEFLLLVTLLIPVLLPRGGGAGAFLGSMIAPVLPGMATLPLDDDSWRRAAQRLIAENADLRARLLALGDPARLKTLDPAYFARRPVRVEAAVVGRDASMYRGSLLVSAGTGDGVRAGLPVLVGEALVGTVAEAGPLASRVRLLVDPGQRVWAEVVSEGDTVEGYVAGTGDDVLELKLARAGTGRAGDPVFTAPADPRIPRGLLLGAVARIEDVDRDGVAEAEIVPAVPPTRIRFVNVLAAEDR